MAEDTNKVDPYSTHLKALRFVIQHMYTACALEFGMGEYSTQFLVENPKVERLISIEQTEFRWYIDIVRKFGYRQWFYPYFIPQIKDAIIFANSIERHLTLVDGASERWLMISESLPCSEVVIAHDAENISWETAEVKKALQGFDLILDESVIPHTAIIAKPELGLTNFVTGRNFRVLPST